MMNLHITLMEVHLWTHSLFIPEMSALVKVYLTELFVSGLEM